MGWTRQQMGRFHAPGVIAERENPRVLRHSVTGPGLPHYPAHRNPLRLAPQGGEGVTVHRVPLRCEPDATVAPHSGAAEQAIQVVVDRLYRMVWLTHYLRVAVPAPTGIMHHAPAPRKGHARAPCFRTGFPRLATKDWPFRQGIMAPMPLVVARTQTTGGSRLGAVRGYTGGALCAHHPQGVALAQVGGVMPKAQPPGSHGFRTTGHDTNFSYRLHMQFTSC